jgi:NodT family efflux transporter outer membrane factor (OMF) lipoprotein
VVLAIALCGCSPHEVARDVKPVVSVPQRFVETSGKDRVAAKWWRTFADPSLDVLVEHALAGNLDLKRAAVRLGIAQALARKNGARSWPELNLDGRINASKSNFFFGKATTPLGGNQIDIVTTTIPLTVAASYELDLWGRIASASAAAQLDLQATAEDARAMAITISSQVVETWFSLLEQRAQRALLRRQVELNKVMLKLIQGRFGQGQADAVAVLQQRQQLAAVRARLPLIEGQLVVLGHQLAALLGRAPHQPQVVDTSTRFPAVPALPSAGLPATVLQRRPDIRAARIRVQAADHRVGVALADRFPNIRLGGSTGFQGRDGLSGFLDTWIWNLVTSVSAPLFDGGRRAAEVDRSRYALKDTVLAYSQVVLRALYEVEDALVQERQQRAHVMAQARQLELAKQTLLETRRRYAGGQGDYLPVMSALQALERVEREHLGARRALLTRRVGLYRALAGSWPAANSEASTRTLGEVSQTAQSKGKARP